MIADHFKNLLLPAPGSTIEKIAMDPLKDDGDTRYRRSADMVYHVPKRSVEEMIAARF